VALFELFLCITGIGTFLINIIAEGPTCEMHSAHPVLSQQAGVLVLRPLAPLLLLLPLAPLLLLLPLL
jgi:hypothetical protein